MTFENVLSSMHKLKVDKKILFNGNFRCSSQVYLYLVGIVEKPDHQQSMPDTKLCFPFKLKCEIRVISYYKE